MRHLATFPPSNKGHVTVDHHIHFFSVSRSHAPHLLCKHKRGGREGVLVGREGGRLSMPVAAPWLRGCRSCQTCSRCSWQVSLPLRTSICLYWQSQGGRKILWVLKKKRKKRSIPALCLATKMSWRCFNIRSDVLLLYDDLLSQTGQIIVRKHW